jgi:16S rRNA processing protein RimM
LNNSRLEIGGIARAHGIRGEVVVVTHDPDSETLAHVKKIYVAGVEHEVVAARDTQRGWLVVLAGVNTRNDAEALRGKIVEVDRDALDLGGDEVLLHDLVGCAVKTTDGTPFGEIAAVEAGEMQDLLVIHHDGKERLLPLVDVFVKAIDLDARVVVVDPPDDMPEMKL